MNVERQVNKSLQIKNNLTVKIWNNVVNLKIGEMLARFVSVIERYNT